jgi:hypothetical protein
MGHRCLLIAHPECQNFNRCEAQCSIWLRGGPRICALWSPPAASASLTRYGGFGARRLIYVNPDLPDTLGLVTAGLTEPNDQSSYQRGGLIKGETHAEASIVTDVRR